MTAGSLRRFVLVPSLVAAAAWVAAVPISAEDVTPAAAEAPAPTIVAYYFHGNTRCNTCRTIEAYAEEAITQGFPAELASGRLVWRVVNVDEPENRHFVQDFQLVTKTVVLVETNDDETLSWQSLDKVWQLVRDKEAFLGYVRDAAGKMLGNH